MSTEFDLRTTYGTTKLFVSTAVQTEEVHGGNRKERIFRTLDNFATRTSLNGIVFIHSSRQVRMKLIWLFVFMSTVSALVYHSYSTVNDYLAYKTKINVERNRMKHLRLPAVTICNQNRIRSSKIGLLSNELQQILDDARRSAKYLWNDQNVKKNDSELNGWLNFVIVVNNFLLELKKQDRDIMNKAGHQLEDMLLWFKFRDSKITEKSAKLFYSDDYNNCYTLDTADFKQMFNGVNQGIELFMYLEPDEYIPEITDTKGIQLVVHPANAYLYPADDGIALSPGMMTLVALTLENITRLGQPYSSCVENDEYIDKYNYTYTVDLCEAMCVPNQYLAVCGCNASSWEDVDYLNNASFCGLNNSCEFEFDNALCSCENPCREIVYKTRVDSTPWPTYTTLKLLVNQLCLKNDFPRDTCTKLRNQRETELRDNFVGVRIFYESMFVTYFNDEAEINLAAFLSNLGGCVGLWIGISVFSVFELLYLLTNMFWTTLPTAKL